MRTLHLSDGIVDLDACVVLRAGRSVGLTAIEHRLLGYLSDRLGQVVARDELLLQVWGYRAGVRSRTIDNVVRRVREKIEREPSEPDHLHVVYGHGLKLVAGSGLAGPTPPLVRATRFVGRRDELALALRCVADGKRAITVLGPPGVGKSRFAEQLVASSAEPSVVVALGAAADVPDAEAAIAAAIGATAEPEAIGRALSRRGSLVLVLDGCERLVPDLGPRVRSWLAVAPGLRVVSTSRRPLGLDDEQRIPLGPLTEDDAVALFLDRVRLVAPSFASEDGVLSLVSAMDRLPLAIELVAARGRAASVPQLLRMLDRRLDLLSADDREIRATLDLSFGLLTAPQRSALHALAVFTGPFTLDDAEAVLGGWVLDRVQALVDHSLIAIRHEADRARYTLYDIVRDRVRELGPPDPEVERRFALHLARWCVEGQGGGVITGGAVIVGEALASLHDLRAAIERMADTEPDLAVRCGLVLLEVYGEAGPYTAGLALVARLEGIRCRDTLRIRVLNCAADLWFALGSTPDAVAAIDRAIGLADPSAVLPLRLYRARLLRIGDPGEAQSELDRVAPAFDELSLRYRAIYHRLQGEVHVLRADLDAGTESYGRARELARSADEPIVLLGVLGLLGMVARRQGRWGEAEALIGESAALGASIGDRRTRALTALALASLERERGRLDVASTLLAEVAAIHEVLGDEMVRVSVDTELAMLDCQRGAPALAAARLVPYLALVPDARLTWTLGVLGGASWLAGDVGAAREAVDRALGVGPGLVLLRAELQGLRALVAASSGDLQSARRWLADGEQVLERAGARAMLAKHLAQAATVERRWGDPAVGRAWGERAARIGDGTTGPSELACWMGTE